jgi:hypothetical protein
MTRTLKITCPRRMKEFGSWEKIEGLDSWRTDKTCSFCGSLDPTVLLELMKTGNVKLGPTDKSYKVYAFNDDMGQKKVYFQHFSEQQARTFVDLYNLKPRPFVMEYPGYFYQYPYFMGSVEGVNDE